jgi:hypothetical protein
MMSWAADVDTVEVEVAIEIGGMDCCNPLDAATTTGEEGVESDKYSGS